MRKLIKEVDSSTRGRKLDLVSVPLTKVREYEPKIFDINDKRSDYNKKFRTKLLKEKVSFNKAGEGSEISTNLLQLYPYPLDNLLIYFS